MLEELNALARLEKLIVEFADGSFVPVEKVYEIKGRGGSLNILVNDFEREDLRRKLNELENDFEASENYAKTLEEDLKDYEKIGQTASEISAKINDLDNECNNVQTSIENLEYKLGLKTKCRQTYDRIDEIAEILEERIRELENEKEFLESEVEQLKVDNQAMVWNIEQLEIWKENTLKDENPTLN